MTSFQSIADDLSADTGDGKVNALNECCILGKITWNESAVGFIVSLFVYTVLISRLFEFAL